MKNIIRICLVVILVYLLNATLYAQGHSVRLEKNRNIQAVGLIHKLNKTRDTLILHSDKKINYLYSVTKEGKAHEFDVYIDSTSFKFPLNKLKKGKHVIVAVQSPKRIVFVVRILKEIPILELEPKSLISKEPILKEPVKVVSTQSTNHRSNNYPLK